MVEIREGNCTDILRTMEKESVQCCVTSPPYYGLRDYGSPDQLGLEKTPEEYVERMVRVFREVHRVLRKDGTLWLNIGDSYAGSGKGPSKSLNGSHHDLSAVHSATVPSGCKPKDLIGIPWMLAFALRADGWYLRSDIIWGKPNPMPESVRDRPTRAHEYVFLLSKSRKYFYDSAAVRTPLKESSKKRLGQNVEAQQGSTRGNGGQKTNGTMKAVCFGGQKGGEDGYAARTRSGGGWVPQSEDPGANLRDVWNIATRPFKGAHFAVMPVSLVEPCVKAGSRIGDLVLDPFAGAGTVGVVAKTLERRFVGIELNPEYAALARTRLEGSDINNQESPFGGFLISRRQLRDYREPLRGHRRV